MDLPTVGLKLIFEFVDRLVGRNTVPQLYIWDLEIICGFVNHTAMRS